MNTLDVHLQEYLLKKTILTEQQITLLMQAANAQRLSFEDILREKNILSDKILKQFIADSFHMETIDLTKLDIADTTLQIIPERIARKYKVIAFDEDKKKISIASSIPQQEDVLSILSQKTGKRIELSYATEDAIHAVLPLYKKDLQDILDRLLKGNMQTTQLADAPVTKIVDVLITYAYREKASDIHIESEEDDVLVRFRIDSVLHDVLVLNKNLHQQIVSRIKVLSKLQTDQHLSAQDGKMRIVIDEKPLDIRVSCIPTTDGEKVVLRLLSSDFKTFSLTELGMRKSDIQKINHVLSKSYGMILSTGPTGSGKTTSIYSLLKSLNSRDRNITTIEDPVEYRIKGVNQIQVNSKTNLTFAQGLRSILRQDPNVIFVGEIRDSETASIGVNAALTGHLVLTTLHTNDAATALPRLIDMKVEPFLVASTVNVILAQRLVRKVCVACKEKVTYSRQDLVKNIPASLVHTFFRNVRSIAFYKGKGCKLCHFTGYIGRIGIFEVLEVSDEIKKLIIEKQDSNIIEKQAIKEGMSTMIVDGIEKALSGLTSIEEVLRVISSYE